MESFDYIVVGAGSAGCVISQRLVAAGNTVLLLEDGPKDNSPFVHMPATFVRLLGTERSVIFQSEPNSHAANRVMHIPQGRMLGGGSSINAMIYIRGQAADYDEWQALGCKNWAWDDVLPVFKRAESNEIFADPYHGTEGLLKVSDARHRHPLSLAFIQAAQQAGLPYNRDFNGEQQTGVGFYQSTTYQGQRGSTASTYLADVRHNDKLTVRTDTKVLSLIMQDERAVGVRYRTSQGEHSAYAAQEVVLSAGTLSTPKILMLSGIGPAAALSPLNIPVVRDLPGVGQNFQDHLEVAVYAQTHDPISLAGQDKGFKAFMNGLQYKLFRSGLLTSNVVESGGFADTDGDGRADVQFHVLPVLVGDVDREPLAGHGLTINPCFLRPQSRGQLSLQSNNPDDPIALDSGFLSHEADVATLMRGVKLARNILRQPALNKLISKELLPSSHETLDDAALEQHIRQYAKTVYHPSGTCKMGEDPLAVVDSQLRVHGIQGLRIADASVIPKIVSGNTNAPTIMIAERCAEFILQGGR